MKCRINMQPTVVIKREPNPAPDNTPWTGFGFMQVFEGSDLTFLIPKIFRTLQYDLVVRHEHTGNFPIEWNKVTYEIISLDGPPSDECSSSTEATPEGSAEPPDDAEGSPDAAEGSPDAAEGSSSTVTEATPPAESRRKRQAEDSTEGSADDSTHTIATGEFSMAPDTTQTTITPSICLNEGKRYHIKLTFDQYDPATPDSGATINIDSVSFKSNFL